MAGAIDLKPDVSWWSGSRCCFVGDVKYKRSLEGHGANADLYQLLSYASAADLPGGILIYAAGEAEPGVHRVRHLGKRLVVVALDLSVSPYEVLGQITSLAERIREMSA